uniref:Spindle and centriole-associated protein 1 n=1 Tax=Propithecus coquereli TaxID=379532 RepID=A0A2K6ER20_PROCO
MSFVRVHRYGPRGGGRKALKVKKKKTSVKQEWDVSLGGIVSNTIRRHEIHKSKNRALAHWELQEKALKRRWKKQKPETLNLEKRRLSIMKEILSDQYQMQDVLEKSDHLMAAAKDLFVDFPRRRTGFPNITMAPDSSQGPIVVNQDPITQAILNESVIEPQALNEVDDEGEEGTVNSQSGESENELDSSLNSEPNMNTDRFYLLEILLKIFSLLAALNATNAVKRIQTRLQPEESTEAVDSSYVVGQVLNSRKQKQLLNKVKRKPDLRASSKQKKNMLSGNTTSADLPSSNNCSLDVLKHMIHEVEHEMEEYEQWTGREVKRLQNSQGLTGFTLSLVSSLCRLVRYLKEVRSNVETVICLELIVHQCLIDVEINTQNVPIVPFCSLNTKILSSFSEGPVVNANVSVPLMFRGEEVVEFPQEELPVKLSQVPNPADSVNLANSFPAHIFEPAVLLTPPRQKTNSEFSPLQDVLRRTVQTRPAPRIPPTVEIIEKEQNWEKKTLPIDADIQSSNEESRLFTQRWRVSHMGEDLENKTQAPVVNLSQPLCNSHSSTQQSRNAAFSDEPPVLGDGQQLRTNEALIQRKDIMARIAELTLQNSAIKAHLNNIIGPGGEQGDGLREPNKQESASDVTWSHVSDYLINSFRIFVQQIEKQNEEGWFALSTHVS